MHTEKILTALSLIENGLLTRICKLESNIAQGRAKIILNDCILYLQYNRFGEYGYQLVFSEKENDLARFDPHHFHPRWNSYAFDSPMQGEPDKDIPLLCELIINRKIWDGSTRF